MILKNLLGGGVSIGSATLPSSASLTRVGNLVSFTINQDTTGGSFNSSSISNGSIPAAWNTGSVPSTEYEVMFQYISELGAAVANTPNEDVDTWYPITTGDRSFVVSFGGAGVTRRIVGTFLIRHISSQIVVASMPLTITTQ